MAKPKESVAYVVSRQASNVGFNSRPCSAGHVSNSDFPNFRYESGADVRLPVLDNVRS